MSNMWEFPTLTRRAAQRQGEAMSTLDRETANDAAVQAGFSPVDDKGRVALAKAIRQELGIEPGSYVAYVKLDHAVLLVPQDDYLATLQRRAAEALASAGLTVRDLLNALPQARDETVTEVYSPATLQEMKRLWETTHPEAEVE
jgi:bifunctional DNA-binding transcriptional regulator/antitoxin component of YhaV-PrlF toxin-antitoxin module